MLINLNIGVNRLCMRVLHENAFFFERVTVRVASGMKQSKCVNAPALKPTHKAGRRGGVSIAR